MIDPTPTHGRYALRPATPDDIDFVCDLLTRCFKSMAEELFGEWDTGHISERVEFMIREGASVIRVDGQDAGFLRYFRAKTGWFELAELELLPGFRGRGIGRQLLRDLLDAADRESCRVELQVFANNPAVALYKRLGFQVSHFKMHRPAGG